MKKANNIILVSKIEPYTLKSFPQFTVKLDEYGEFNSEQVKKAIKKHYSNIYDGITSVEEKKHDSGYSCFNVYKGAIVISSLSWTWFPVYEFEHQKEGKNNLQKEFKQFLEILEISIEDLINSQELYLSNNSIENLPDSIGNLVNLQELDLSYNSIEVLPDSIGNLVNLQELDLSYNSIENLPDSIGNLVNLQKLYLSNNSIEVLPESIGNLVNLQKLYLYNNSIEVIPESIGNLVNLQWLYLNENPIDLKEIQKIKKLLPNCEIYY